jgi:hypothetical protein
MEHNHAMLCYAILCYAILCYAVLCYAVLCCAMLCYTMLCYTMLCCALQSYKNISFLKIPQPEQYTSMTQSIEVRSLAMI